MRLNENICWPVRRPPQTFESTRIAPFLNLRLVGLPDKWIQVAGNPVYRDSAVCRNRFGNQDPSVVSNSLVSRVAAMRWLTHTSVSAVVFAVLYKFWLTVPVLQYVSLGNWRLFAIAAAAACGCVLSLLRFSTLALSCGTIVGLLLGGTWAAWKLPNDMAISVYAALASHLELFWRETSVLTLTVTLVAFWYAFFAKRRVIVRSPGPKK
jgi:hypothetical protein